MHRDTVDGKYLATNNHMNSWFSDAQKLYKFIWFSDDDQKQYKCIGFSDARKPYEFIGFADPIFHRDEKMDLPYESIGVATIGPQPIFS